MELPKLVLKCLFAAHRAHRVGAQHWHRAAGLLRPLAHVRHHHVARAVARGLAGAQGACRYVPMAAGVAAGVTLLPASAMPPAAASVPAIHAAAAPADASAGAGDGIGAFPSAGVAGGAGSGPDSGAAPPGPGISVPPEVVSPVPYEEIPGPPQVGLDDGHPGHPFVPPQTASEIPATPVPEAPSVALFLPMLALLALARQMRCARSRPAR